MTRASHDPLADHARQSLAAHYRRLADAALAAAAELGGETAGDLDRHQAAVADAVEAVRLGHRSLDAVRRGRLAASEARAC